MASAMKLGIELACTFGFALLALSCAGKTQPQAEPASQPATPAASESGQPSSKPAVQETATPTAVRPQPKADNSLPARKLFAGDPDYANVQVSPDGKYLSYLAEVEGVMNVWTAPIDQPEQAAALTSVKDRPLRNYFWAY